MTDPLVVNPDIELPQLDISNNKTTDCTIEYSTGVNNNILVLINIWTIHVVYRLQGLDYTGKLPRKSQQPL